MQKMWSGAAGRSEILFKMRNGRSADLQRNGKKDRCYCGCGENRSDVKTGSELQKKLEEAYGEKPEQEPDGAGEKQQETG